MLSQFHLLAISIFDLQILDGSNTFTIHVNVYTHFPFYFISKSNKVEIVILSKYNDASENEFKIIYKSK